MLNSKWAVRENWNNPFKILLKITVPY